MPKQTERRILAVLQAIAAVIFMVMTFVIGISCGIVGVIGLLWGFALAIGLWDGSVPMARRAFWSNAVAVGFAAILMISGLVATFLVLNGTATGREGVLMAFSLGLMVGGGILAILLSVLIWRLRGTVGEYLPPSMQ